MNPALGQVIDGKYKLVRLLGAGGMGAVYEGENQRIRRRVAIKMLHAQVGDRTESVTRFEREAQAAGTIGSEHICEVLDLGVLEDGTRYMVMEYLEGETLGARIKTAGRLAPAAIAPLVTQVLDGLAAAHAAGIIHRDLKPDNVWIVPQRGGIKDFVKVLDFGVSKFSQGGEEMGTTRAGAVVGTPYYMSPEQARGSAAIDARTDIYAIGVVLYQAVTGQVPYQAETFNELLFKIVLEVAPPPQTYVPDLDLGFVAIIQKAMGREPAQRYATCQEFKDALIGWLAAHPGEGPVSLATSSAARPVPTTTAMPVHAAPVMPPSVATRVISAGTMMMDSAPSRLFQAPMSVPIATPPVRTPPPSAIVVGPMGPASSGDTWGNISTMPSPAVGKRKSSAALVVVGVMLFGGVAAAAVAFGRGSVGSSATAAPSPSNKLPVAPRPSTPAAPPASPPPTPSGSASAAPVASAPPSASAEAAPEGSLRAPLEVAAPSVPSKPKGRLPAGRPAPVKPPPRQPEAPAAAPRPAGDLGY